MNEQILIKDGVKYNLYEYKKEAELEKMIIEYCKDIFGENSLYFDKQKIETKAGIKGIPDGFVISLDLKKWYILEIELASHDLYQHIVPQVTKFHKAYQSSDTRKKISRALYDNIKENPRKKTMLELIGITGEQYKFLSDLIDSTPQIVIFIDHKTQEAEEVCDSLPFENKIIEFKTFVREGTENVYAHLFEPLHESKPRESKESPAREKIEISSTTSQDRNKIPIFTRYKGKEYRATFIKLKQQVEYKGKLGSPSGIGKQIIDAGSVNGWIFWKYVDSDGKTKPIDNLRRR